MKELEGRKERIMAGKNGESGDLRKMGHGRKKVIKGPPIDFTYIIDELGLHDGDRIVNEGSYGNWTWVILEGQVNITRMTPRGPVVIARLGEGAFIGNFKSFLFEDYVRSATATAKGDVHIGLLDTLALSGEFSSLSSRFRGLLLSLNSRMKKITDRAVELFMTEGISRNTTYKPDKWKKKPSEKGIFTIKEGEAYVVGQNRKGSVPLITLEKGDVFGSLPFVSLGQEPGNATVSGAVDLKFHELDHQKLLQEYNQLSGTFRNLLEHIGTCTSKTTHSVSDLCDGK